MKCALPHVLLRSKVQLSCVSEGVSHIIMCQYKVYYVSSDSGLIKT